jgi:hypothetical protein
MKLPEIIKYRMDMEINDQLSVTLFPDDEGQPKCDVLKLNLTEIDEKKISIYMTPCEAMEIASALNSAVQFYLHNQEQYREEILCNRMKLSEECEKSVTDIQEFECQDKSTLVKDTLAIMEEDVDEHGINFDEEYSEYI